MCYSSVVSKGYSCGGCPLPYDVLVLLILALGVAPAAVHDARVHVCRTEGVRLVEQGYHREQHGSDRLRGVPALAGQLARMRVVDGRVQNRYAQVAVLENNAELFHDLRKITDSIFMFLYPDYAEVG